MGGERGGEKRRLEIADRVTKQLGGLRIRSLPLHPFIRLTMHQYKAVVFDYGGVLMSYCKEVPEWSRSTEARLKEEGKTWRSGEAIAPTRPPSPPLPPSFSSSAGPLPTPPPLPSTNRNVEDSGLEKKYGLREGSIQKTLFAIFKDYPELDRLLFIGTLTAEDIEEKLLPEYLSRKFGVDLPRPFPVLNLWMGPGSKIPFNDNMMGVVRTLKNRGMHTSILTNNYKMDRKGLKVRTPVDMNLFDLIVESTREGFMKPDMQIYEIIQSRIPSSISPHECIFLDDNKENIRAAREFGWTPILVDPHNIEQSIRDLERLLNIDLTQ